MKKMALFSLMSILAALVFIGCPSTTPPVQPTVETGKVIVSGNVFGDDNDVKSLNQAGLAQLKQLMAEQIDSVRIEVLNEAARWYFEGFFSVDRDGNFLGKIVDVPAGDCLVKLQASNNSDNVHGVLLQAEAEVVVSKEENKIVLRPELLPAYNLGVRVNNLPGYYSQGTTRGCEFLDDEGQVINNYASISPIRQEDGKFSKATLHGRINVDAVVRMITWPDDNGEQVEMPCNLSLLDMFTSGDEAGYLIIDYRDLVDVTVDLDFSSPRPPSLTLTTNEDGSLTAIFSQGDFIFCAGEWHLASEGISCEERLYSYIFFGENEIAIDWGMSIKFDQSLVIPAAKVIKMDWWNDSQYGDYYTRDILATLDGTPISSDGDTCWYLQ